MSYIKRIIITIITLTITITIAGCSKEKEETIMYNGDLKGSIDVVIKNKGNETVSGDFIASSYELIGVDKVQGYIYSYVIYSSYGFECQGDVLKKVSGLTTLPLKLIFQVYNEGTKDEYYVLSRINEVSQEYSFETNVQLIFANRLWDKGFAAKTYKEALEEDILKQAQEYVKDKECKIDLGK